MGRLTLNVIRREMHSLLERRSDDMNLHHPEGTVLYGAADATDLPLLDALYPDQQTHRIIGERFADYAFAANGSFAAASRH